MSECGAYNCCSCLMTAWEWSQGPRLIQQREEKHLGLWECHWDEKLWSLCYLRVPLHFQNGELTLSLPTLRQLQLGFLWLVPSESWVAHMGCRWQSQDLESVLCDSRVHDLTQHISLSCQLHSISCLWVTWSISRQVSTTLKIRLCGSLPRVLIPPMFVPLVYKSACIPPLLTWISVYEPVFVPGLCSRSCRKEDGKDHGKG